MTPLYNTPHIEESIVQNVTFCLIRGTSYPRRRATTSNYTKCPCFVSRMLFLWLDTRAAPRQEQRRPRRRATASRAGRAQGRRRAAARAKGRRDHDKHRTASRGEPSRRNKTRTEGERRKKKGADTYSPFVTLLPYRSTRRIYRDTSIENGSRRICTSAHLLRAHFSIHN